jgi:hypothetical protein
VVPVDICFSLLPLSFSFFHKQSAHLLHKNPPVFSQQLGIHLISILAIIKTGLNTAKMRIHSVLAGLFLLLAVAIASVPQIEIKASISSLFGAFKQLTRPLHRDPSSSMPTMALNCELINCLKLLQLLISRLATSVALPTRVWILDNETLPTLP